jgi:hypothetical protein
LVGFDVIVELGLRRSAMRMGGTESGSDGEEKWVWGSSGVPTHEGIWVATRGVALVDKNGGWHSEWGHAGMAEVSALSVMGAGNGKNTQGN